MALLTDPINERNVISRYKDYMYPAWQGVAWGTNNSPIYAEGTYYQTQVIPFSAFRGSTFDNPGADAFIGKLDGTIANPGEGPITAERIHAYLNFFTYTHCYVRRIRALLTITGDGGNTGNYPYAGNVYDVTAIGYMNFLDTQFPNVFDYVTPVSGGVAANQVVSALELQYFMERCLQAYNNFARNQTYVYQPIICHASCHASCHSSRGRR